MNRFTACSLMGIVLLLGGACATSSMVPSASVTTMQPVWPQYFKVEWVAEPPGSGRIAGYLYNTHGIPATNVQILAQALDASGSVIAQRIAWIPGVVPDEERDELLRKVGEQREPVIDQVGIDDLVTLVADRLEERVAEPHHRRALVLRLALSRIDRLAHVGRGHVPPDGQLTGLAI